MLPKILSQSSPMRRKLSFLARRFNFAVSPKLRNNFTYANKEDIDQLQELLKNTYFPSWYTGIDMDNFYSSEAAQTAFDNHLFRRLEMDRYRFIPWIDNVVNLKNATVLEIGCGTGSASLALAEQGAMVTGIDVHSEALEIAKFRCHIHGLSDVSFIQGNAQDIKELVEPIEFDLIIFFAALEHMTLEERQKSLQAAWEILPIGKHICITETPNRLWPYDGHTSQMPFFHWLPDQIAFEYSKLSPRYPFNMRFRNANADSMLSFCREGRGFSYHEIDLSLGHSSKYEITSDIITFLSLRNPAILLKRIVERDGKREKLLRSYAQERHRGLFRQHLDIIIKKLQ